MQHILSLLMQVQLKYIRAISSQLDKIEFQMIFYTPWFSVIEKIEQRLFL